jgi:hypothetical protein
VLLLFQVSINPNWTSRLCPNEGSSSSSSSSSSVEAKCIREDVAFVENNKRQYACVPCNKILVMFVLQHEIKQEIDYQDDISYDESVVSHTKKMKMKEEKEKKKKKKKIKWYKSSLAKSSMSVMYKCTTNNHTANDLLDMQTWLVNANFSLDELRLPYHGFYAMPLSSAIMYNNNNNNNNNSSSSSYDNKNYFKDLFISLVCFVSFLCILYIIIKIFGKYPFTFSREGKCIIRQYFKSTIYKYNCVHSYL